MEKELPPIGARIKFRLANFQEYQSVTVTGHRGDGKHFYVNFGQYDTTLSVDDDWKYD